jgi:hypothetical protein
MTVPIARCVLQLLLLASAPALAQAAAPPESPAEPEPEVLIKKGVRHGGWGGPVLHVSTVRDRAAILVGGRGGWLIDGRFTIGGGGFGLTNSIRAPDAAQVPGQEPLDLRMGYGGGWLEYTFAPLKLVHLSAGVLIGGGEVSLAFRHGGAYGRNDGFFVAEPTLVAELNLAKHVRVDVGAAYRWIAGADLPGLSVSDVSGPSGVLVFKFGKF